MRKAERVDTFNRQRVCVTVLPVAERVDGRAAEPGGQAAQVRCVGRGHRLDDDTPLLVSTVTTVEQFASSLIATATHMPQEITRCVTCHRAEVTIPSLGLQG